MFDIEVPIGYQIEQDFSFHAPTADKVELYRVIREKAKELAVMVAHLVPDCKERHQSLLRLNEVVFWANSGIARSHRKEV